MHHPRTVLTEHFRALGRTPGLNDTAVERMTKLKRFRNWVSLTRSEQAAASAVCRLRTSSLGMHLNAVATLLPDWDSGSGSLAGLPYVAKDMFGTGVHSPSHGLSTPPPTDGRRAEVLLRLDRAGASLIAAAEMTALAYEPSGYNAARGRVLNPWDFDAVTGGSSSGPAALVAAGCAFAALGSDTGGSVRIPASCCGVTSLKPTPGAIPETGAMALAPSLDTIGLFARGAEDLSLLWPVVSMQSVAPARVERAARLTCFFEVSSPDVRAACDRATDTLADLGVSIASRGGFVKLADELAMTVMQGEAARAFGMLDIADDPLLRKRLSKGLGITERMLSDCLAERDRLREEFLHMLGDADVALTPTMPIAVPDAAETDPASDRFRARTLYDLSQFTRFVNFLGLPAMSLPAGFDNKGRPVGLQIIGRQRQEAQLIALATRFQDVTDWHGRVPKAIEGAINDESEAAA